MPSNDEGARYARFVEDQIEACVGRHRNHDVLLESQHGQLLLTAHRNVGRQTFAQQNRSYPLGHPAHDRRPRRRRSYRYL